MSDMLQRDAWIRLARSLSVRQFWKVINHFKCPLEAIKQQGALRYSILDLCKEKELVVKNNCKWLLYNDPEYPPLLKEIYNAPPVLHVKGNVNILSDHILACIGARSCSLHGAKFASDIVSVLSGRGWKIASGMAIGIDTAVHKASLCGGTIAVLAGGIDQIYPKENENLYHAIIENNGAIISENIIGAPTTQVAFHGRNRLIVGLSEALIVIEAAMKSGSYSTARIAGEYGREVFVAPGSPYDIRSAGSNMLIKNGASMLLSVDDIELRVCPDTKLSESPIDANKDIDIPNVNINKEIDDEEIKILDLLTYYPTAPDDIAMELGCNTSQLRIILSMMELKDLIKILPDGCIIKLV